MPDAVTKQTIKQARASYKSRGRPTLTGREQRQLERAVELEDRAERAKEAEKRRAEAAKKRAEAEKRQQSGKQQQQLGSQRRYDRFGYKSSQFHLGAFFGQKSAQKAMRPVVAVQEEAEDGFDDDGLDDNSLLEALEGPQNRTKPSPRTDTNLMPPPPPPPRPVSIIPQYITQAALPHPDDDLRGFFDELESSTQIARELDSSDDEFGEPPDFCHVSFSSETSSGSFDLTEEDMEMLDPARATASGKGLPGVLPTRTTISRTYSQRNEPTFQQKFDAPQRPQNSLPTAGRLGQSANLAWQMTPQPLPACRSSNASANTTPSLPSKSMPPPPRPHPLASNAEGRAQRQIAPSPPLPTSKSPNQPASKAATTHSPQQPSLPQHVTKSPHKQATGAAPNKDHNTAPENRNLSLIRGPFLPASSLYCSPDLGFTMTQLESLVDDDLQLTQVA